MKHRIILLIVIAPTVCGALLGLMWCLTMPINANAKTAEASLLNVQGTPTVDPTVAALQKDQLIQEVTGLETDNAWYWVIWIKLSPSLTVLVGIVIGFWSLFRWLRDRRDEQKRREEDLQIDRMKRSSERFEATVAALGSQEVGMRIGAAITLRTFLDAGYKQFHRQIFDLAVANLRLRKVDPDTPVPLEPLDQVLIMVFKEAFPKVRDELKDKLEEAKAQKVTQAQIEPQSLSAANIQLDNAYLSSADLKEAWLLEAFLRQADLRNAHLENVHLEEANLDGARLIDAHLEGSYLNGVALIKANLERAKLTNAHMEGARLVGANLGGTDLQWAHLNDANLTGTDLGVAHLENAWLIRANLTGANLEGARLTEAHLDGANPEDAKSLKGAILRNAVGLTQKQLVACSNKGAIVDDLALQAVSDTNLPDRQTSE